MCLSCEEAPMDRLASIRGKASTKINSFVECSRFMAPAERQDRKRVLSSPCRRRGNGRSTAEGFNRFLPALLRRFLKRGHLTKKKIRQEHCRHDLCWVGNASRN